jgi:hypothetical protein
MLKGEEEEHSTTGQGQHRTAAMPGKLEDTQRASQTDPRTGSHKANSRVFCQTDENDCQDILEEPVPAKLKKKNILILCAVIIGEPATCKSVFTSGKKKGQCMYWLLGTTSPKEESCDMAPESHNSGARRGHTARGNWWLTTRDGWFPRQ